MLITLKELKKIKSRGSVSCECKMCLNPFFITKNLAQRVLKGTKKADFCKKKCYLDYLKRKNLINRECGNCGKTILRKIYQICDTGNVYCSRRCSLEVSREKNRKKNLCLNCAKGCGSKRLCNRSCSNSYKNKIRELDITNNPQKYSNAAIRKFLIKIRGDSCSKCGWREVNPKTLKCPIQLNHIDGHSENKKFDNLELVCPNCHSLTPTFGSLNMGNGRFLRRERYKLGLS